MPCVSPDRFGWLLALLAVACTDGNSPDPDPDGAAGSASPGPSDPVTSSPFTSSPGATRPVQPTEFVELFVARDLGLVPAVTGREPGETILEANGGGVALFDADGDGDLELALIIPGPYPTLDEHPERGSNRLYRNDGDWQLEDVTAGSGIDVPGWCNAAAVGDVDSDGRRDLYITRLGPNALLRNEGQLHFGSVPGAGGAAGDAWSTSATFVDLDRDGDLDLYVVNYLSFDPAHPPQHGTHDLRCTWEGMAVMCGPQGLPAQADRYYRNDDGQLVDATEATGFDATPGYGLGVIEGDFDQDGWPDIYVSNDSTPNHLFRGTGDGSVSEAGVLSGAALSSRGREQAGMGIAAGDVDGDGDEDLLVTNFALEPNALYLNQGGGRFRDGADPSGIGGPSRRMLGWGAAFVDVDLDSDLDLIVANGHVYHQADLVGPETSYAQADALWIQDDKGRFRITYWPGNRLAVSRALAVGDLDDDGISDLVIVQRTGPAIVWQGLGPRPGAAPATLQVTVSGPPGNPDGLGCRVRWQDADGTRTVTVRSSAGYQAASDPRPIFAWRGPGQLDVVRPDGTIVTRQIETAGPVRVDITGP